MHRTTWDAHINALAYCECVSANLWPQIYFPDKPAAQLWCRWYDLTHQTSPITQKNHVSYFFFPSCILVTSRVLYDLWGCKHYSDASERERNEILSRQQSAPGTVSTSVTSVGASHEFNTNSAILNLRASCFKLPSEKLVTVTEVADLCVEIRGESELLRNRLIKHDAQISWEQWKERLQPTTTAQKRQSRWFSE